MINTEGNITKVTPADNIYNCTEKSVSECVNMARMTALTKKLSSNYCTNCNICNQSVSKCTPNGSITASIMFVDALPSEDELFTGAFTDAKGYLLNDCLANLRVDRSSIYCTNILKCNATQSVNESIINNCLKQYFYRELDIVKPKTVAFTYSAFQVALKYKIIPYIGNINYFTKTTVVIDTKQFDIFVTYDIQSLTEQNIEAFKTGIGIILQQGGAVK